MKIINTIGLLAATSLVATTAFANSFGISTYSNNYLGDGCGQGSSYTTGSGASAGTTTPGLGLDCIYSSNYSTPSGAGSLTAYSESSSSALYPSDGESYTVDDWAEASLATGQLHLYSSDTNNYGPGDYGIGENNASAYLNDTLYFTNPDAGAQTQWQIMATFEFDGTSSAGNLSIEGPSHSTYVDFGNPVNTLAEWSVDNGSDVSCNNEENTNVTFLACTPTDWVTQAVLTITGPTATVPIGMGLYLGSNGNDIADFSNTASVAFTLPQDVTFTSASGVFMTESAVPEPGTFALAAGFLAAMAFLKGRRAGSDFKSRRGSRDSTPPSSPKDRRLIH